MAPPLSNNLLFPLGVAVSCYLAGCAGTQARPVEIQSTDNPQIRVERLFDQDGCTVYRFYDGRYSQPRYFAKCSAGTASVSWRESCGRACVTEQTVPTANVAE